MDLFNENALLGLYKEEKKNKMFQKDSQTLRIVSISDASTSLKYLLGIKQLFQKMLPKMPKKYILRQVFDYKHCSLVLEDSYGVVVGAACYRPAFERNLIELFFLQLILNITFMDTEHFYLIVLKRPVKSNMSSTLM